MQDMVEKAESIYGGIPRMNLSVVKETLST
jgi:hypothetical protein